MNENDEYKYFSFRLSKVTINDFCRSVQTAKVAEKIIGRFGVEFYIAGFESVDFCVGLTSPMIPPSLKMEFLRFQFVPIEEGGLRVNVRYSNHDIERRRDYLAGLFRAIAKDWTEAREEINKAIAELTGQPAADMDAEKSKPKPNKKMQKRAVIWRDLRPWILSAKVRPTAKECIAEIRKKQGGYKEKQISRQRMSTILSEGLSGMYDEILENL
ncbi:MAG: hypothetical protein LC108_06185 [Anaerolineales bacterium]|nr:hypothetical protein [Anaerolineales bacterium]